MSIFRAGELFADSHEQVKGIDVSQWQGKVRWEVVKHSGISFGYAKATGGITCTDPEFVNNWNGMREAGMPRGAYHFFYAHDAPQKQAENFIGALQKNTVKPDDLPPVLDLEITDKMSKAQIAERAFVWLQVVEKALGKKPILYTDPGFANEYLTAPKFADYRLWVAPTMASKNPLSRKRGRTRRGPSGNTRKPAKWPASMGM